MGQNNQKDQKGPKMTAAVMLLQNNQKNWSLHISHTILKVRFFWDTLYFLDSPKLFCESETNPAKSHRFAKDMPIKLPQALQTLVSPALTESILGVQISKPCVMGSRNLTSRHAISPTF